MGYGGTMNDWDPKEIKNLSQNHTVIVFDNRGAGYTDSGNKNFTISQFAKDTGGLLNALKIKKTDVLGFSMGGFIAQGMALKYPEKIVKLVIYPSNCGGNETIPVTNDFAQIIQNKSKSIDEIINGLTTFIFLTDWTQQNLKSIEKFKEDYKVPPVISMETIQNKVMQFFHGIKLEFAIN